MTAFKNYMVSSGLLVALPVLVVTLVWDPAAASNDSNLVAD
jgi:hypothetical protein